MERVSLEDRGFDLVLGGGLCLVQRVPGKAGTSLLVRGPAGAGKTLVAINAALAVAKQRRGSIAYGCIEILPSEIDAQVQSYWPDRGDFYVRYSGKRVPPRGGTVLVARLLELAGDPEALGNEIERFLQNLRDGDEAPAVLVIDSLIEGYGLGATAARDFVDSLCKLPASEGIVLILLEECAPGSLSPWVYAADTVIELGPATEEVGEVRAAPIERRMTVLKHRFSPSDAGPHRFLLEGGKNVQVQPRPSAWIEPWTLSLEAGVPTSKSAATRQFHFPHPKTSSIDAPGLVLAVFGDDVALVHRIARCMKPTSTRGKVEVEVDFTHPLGHRETITDGSSEVHVLGVAQPYMSAHRLLRVVLDEVREKSLQRIVLGDLRTLRSSGDGEDRRRALGVFCALMRRLQVPVVLYETTASRATPSASSFAAAPGVAPPPITDFADLSVEVANAPAGTLASPHFVLVTDLHRGAVHGYSAEEITLGLGRG